MKAFVIECRTGCSCCSYDNHYRGPYSTREIAERKVEAFQEARLLSSQYSKTGIYHIEEHDAEVLPDGRVIIDNTVFSGFKDEPGDEDQIETSWRSY